MNNQIFSSTGESIFSVVSRLADRHDAIDLGQGYPSYAPPERLTEILSELPSTTSNHQYADPRGLSDLREELSNLYSKQHGVNYDPEDEITVTSGATEGICSALLGLLSYGDEIVVFEPVYDQYVPVARRSGAEVKILPLHRDTFGLPVDKLENTIDDDTDFLLLNNPHNPTGQVFSEAKLQRLAELSSRHNVIVLCDEVYENLTFDGTRHRPFVRYALDGTRTLTFGSAGKSFDATGWKIGWVLGDSSLMESVRLAHQYTTYCSATPLQKALSYFLEQLDHESYFRSLRKEYTRRRDTLLKGLERSKFKPVQTCGSYFVVAEAEDAPNKVSSETKLASWMIEEYGVAAIPLRAFCEDGSDRFDGWFRFAFCKPIDRIKEATDRLSQY